jgi:hypothetical protein
VELMACLTDKKAISRTVPALNAIMKRAVNRMSRVYRYKDNLFIYAISGSYGDEYGSLLRCCAVMMEAVSTSETSVNLYQVTRRNIPEDIFIYLFLMQLFLLTGQGDGL